MARAASAGSQVTNSPDRALLAAWQRRQEMRRGTLDFVEYAPQMGRNHQAQFRCRACSHLAGFVERSNHTIQGIVLAEVQNLVLPREVVVEICRRKGGRGCDVAHTGLREPTDAKLFSRGAQDLQAPRKIAPPQMAIALALSLAV